MNILNGKLNVFSTMLVENTADMWTLGAEFIDTAGLFYATDVIVGDIIYIDGTPYNLGILRYRIVELDTVQTDLYNLYVTIQWDTYAVPNEPYSGFESCIGRIVYGSVFLPSPSIQNLSASFIDYIRNSESARASQVGLVNRTYNGPYQGDKDGFNQVFQILDSFILETLEVHVNGIRQNPGDGTDPNDFILISNNEIQFTTTPSSRDILTFNYNKK
jgi:hypothetical protein